MSKAIIISHVDNGEYVVDLQYDAEYLKQLIDQLNADYTRLRFEDYVNALTQRDEQKVIVDDALAVVDQAIIDYNAAVATYKTTPSEANKSIVDEKQAAVEAATLEALRMSKDYQQALAQVEFVEGRLSSLTRKMGVLRNHSTERRRAVLWCIDLADGKKNRKMFNDGDEVATIEISGQEENGQVLVASWNPDTRTFDGGRDGRLTNVAGFTSFELFYNLAMLPAWQQWRHRYRSGTILSGDRVAGWTVVLDNTKCDLQYLPGGRSIEVNNVLPGFGSAKRTLPNVHATYMNCDDMAFAINDHVVVDIEFTGTPDSYGTAASIIGFVDNPKACNINGFFYQPVVVGGTSPGTKPWQDVRATPSGWEMITPVTSDVITGGETSDLRDWKGYRNDGDKALVQWGWRGDNIYLDGELTAVIPTFQLTIKAGDPTANAVPNGFYAAWITPDNKYLYAIPYEANTKTRHVLRKTTNIELTGVAYNATTAPDGWEVSDPFGPDDYTYFQGFGIPRVNQSGTDSRSMDTWTHGFYRSPQVIPGGGTYHPSWTFYSDWPEESHLTISAPSASTIAGAGITCSFNGFIGAGIFRAEGSNPDGIHGATGYWNYYGIVTCANNEYYAHGRHIIRTSQEYSGWYATHVGYTGDTLGYIKAEGFGSFMEVQEWGEDGTCLPCTPFDQYFYDSYETSYKVTDDGGLGIRYVSDFDTWELAINVEEVNYTRTYTRTPPACVGVPAFCERSDYTYDWTSDHRFGWFVDVNVADRIFVYVYDRRDQHWVQTYGGPGSTQTGAACSGNFLQDDVNYENAEIHLGGNSFDFSRVDQTTFSDAPANINYDTTNWPDTTLHNIGLTTESDDPKYPPEPDMTIDTYNITHGYESIWTPHNPDYFVGWTAAMDHAGNYMSSTKHLYNDPQTTLEYWEFLTAGDLGALDELDNGTGTLYSNIHVSNAGDD